MLPALFNISRWNHTDTHCYCCLFLFVAEVWSCFLNVFWTLYNTNLNKDTVSSLSNKFSLAEMKGLMTEDWMIKWVSTSWRPYRKLLFFPAVTYFLEDADCQERKNLTTFNHIIAIKIYGLLFYLSFFRSVGAPVSLKLSNHRHQVPISNITLPTIPHCMDHVPASRYQSAGVWYDRLYGCLWEGQENAKEGTWYPTVLCHPSHIKFCM